MTELQLEFIRKFGRKELSMGCILLSEKYKRILRYIGEDNGQHALSVQDSKGHIMLYLDSMNGGETLGHPVQWHDVFARLLEQKNIVQLFGKRIKVLREYDAIRDINNYILDIEVDATESPMEQPELIKQLLLLSN